MVQDLRPSWGPADSVFLESSRSTARQSEAIHLYVVVVVVVVVVVFTLKAILVSSLSSTSFHTPCYFV